MNNQNLLRGLFLMAVALAFGLGSLNYTVGTFSRAGPGMFPLLVSGLLFLIGLLSVIRSFLAEKVPIDVKFKNLLIIIGSLCGFALISHYVNMSVATVFLVFLSGLAAPPYSVMRNLKIAVGLLLVAVVFQKLLGLNLPLY